MSQRSSTDNSTIESYESKSVCVGGGRYWEIRENLIVPTTAVGNAFVKYNT